MNNKVYSLWVGGDMRGLFYNEKDAWYTAHKYYGSDEDGKGAVDCYIEEHIIQQENKNEHQSRKIKLGSY